MGDILKKEIMPGVHLVVDSVDILSDSQTSKIVTDLQKNVVKTYFSNRKISDIQTVLADMASDSVITPPEKLTLSNKMTELAVDHTVLLSEAAAEEVTGSQEYSDYNTTYNTLLGYINPILATPLSSSTIDGELYLSLWEDYWDTRASLSAAIDDSILATVVTKEEAFTGYDLIVGEEVIATTVPNIPNVVGASSKRNIYLSWPRQKNLTGQNIRYELQCAETAFVSDDLALGYSIGPGGDNPDDWQGASGAVSIVDVNSLLINNFPLSYGETGPGAKQYFFRVRCRQSDNNVSDWGECSVNVTTINQTDLSADTVTKQIQALQNQVTVGANGFLGANYDLDDDYHIFTTNDQRIYIDADELTIQKVTTVDGNNVPTWSDVMKVGGEKRAIILKELGQRIGMDLDGADEQSLAFGKAIADFSSYPVEMPDEQTMAVQASGNIAFVDTDTNTVLGFINTTSREFFWKGNFGLEGVFTGGGVGASRVLFYDETSTLSSGVYYESGPITVPAFSRIKAHHSGADGFDGALRSTYNTLEYRLDSGAWVQFTYNAGYVQVPYVNGSLSRIPFSKEFILDFSSVDHDQIIEIRFLPEQRPVYNYTLLIENMIAARGETGAPGPAGPPGNIENVPIGTIWMFDAHTPATIDGVPVLSGQAGQWTDNVTMPGWYACVNGNQAKGCPNLVDSFIMGKVLTGSGQTGGTNAMLLTTAHLPAHSHTASCGNQSANHSHSVSGGSHSHSILADTNEGSGSAYPLSSAVAGRGTGDTWRSGHVSSTSHTHTVGNQSADHNHTITVANSTGGGNAFDNRPAFYSLIYIRKCA